ncbi:MAG TPA: zinc-dependent metalloprotease [Acidobacteriota bacterium]|nr:zinc-dependent metalloprotease [Acidobacteriota bacterium]
MIERPRLRARRIVSLFAVLFFALTCTAAPAVAQGAGDRGTTFDSPGPIEDRVAAMERLDGLLPLYWDATTGTLYMEIARFDEDILYVRGLAAGLGSNDIGLDRGQGRGRGDLVRFKRIGPKILMLQPNLRYRADSDNVDERVAVEEAFAQSVLWGFTVAAETDGRALVDMTEFLLRDTHGVAVNLQPAQYRLDSSRSVISREHTKAFPKNIIMNATLTFTTQGGGGRGFGGFGTQAGPGGGFGRGALSAVTPSTEAVTVRTHHQFVELPDGDYRPRAFDPRAGANGLTYEDYAVPLGTPLTQRFVNRHRLQKVDPSAEVSDVVEPIVYYLDRGTPEPIRSALLDGARWWNQAYEAAGYRNAFQVEILPEGADNLDVRYNIIQWVHRSTRGWSYGGSVSDPRTGEIIKGRVTLGSLRVRQDYLIAEGLLSPYANGTETPPELAEWALARLRQLSAHEVGHTLGFGHNYYASSLGRISVMDYPHPLIELTDDGELDYSAVYDDKIGEWDKVAVAYAYQDFPAGADEAEELRAILDEAWERDVLYMTNQDMSAQPRVHWWANGDDPVAELDRMMTVRRHALDRFGDNAIKLGAPLATIEEALVPLYLHHRYQVQATASAIGGANYHYALRGDGHGNATGAVPGAEQSAALDSLLATLQPAALSVPRSVLALLPPRPSGYGRHRELFPRYTGMTFDAITPAVVAAQHVLANIFDPARAARMVQQHALDSSLPGLVDVLDQTLNTVFTMRSGDGYEQEIIRAVQRATIEQVMSLSSSAPMPQVRAITTSRLATLSSRIADRIGGADAMIGPSQAHLAMLERDVERFLARPAAAYSQPDQRSAPPGAPIGQPAPSWLDPELMSADLPPTSSMLDSLFPAPAACSWSGR